MSIITCPWKRFGRNTAGLGIASYCFFRQEASTDIFSFLADVQMGHSSEQLGELYKMIGYPLQGSVSYSEGALYFPTDRN